MNLLRYCCMVAISGGTKAVSVAMRFYAPTTIEAIQIRNECDSLEKLYPMIFHCNIEKKMMFGLFFFQFAH